MQQRTCPFPLQLASVPMKVRRSSIKYHVQCRETPSNVRDISPLYVHLPWSCPLVQTILASLPIVPSPRHSICELFSLFLQNVPIGLHPQSNTREVSFPDFSNYPFLQNNKNTTTVCISRTPITYLQTKSTS